VAASRKFAVDPAIYVSCLTCSREITVLNTIKSLPREFSVRCPKCGRRNLYQVGQVHEQTPVAENARISNRIQFGIKGKTDGDRTPGEPKPVKSGLGGFMSWLLQ
jgi:DNA-directed RNA polymerase subunit RPC12/RpoP